MESVSFKWFIPIINLLIFLNLPLHALEINWPEILKTEKDTKIKEMIFANHQIDLLSQDGQGRSFIHHLALEKETALMEFFLYHFVRGNYKKRFDINQVDYNGQSALHIAALFGLPEMTKLLLYYKANSSLVDHNGKTPLDLAIENRYPQTRDLLKLANKIPLQQENEHKKVSHQQKICPTQKNRTQSTHLCLIYSPDKSDKYQITKNEVLKLTHALELLNQIKYSKAFKDKIFSKSSYLDWNSLFKRIKIVSASKLWETIKDGRSPKGSSKIDYIKLKSHFLKIGVSAQTSFLRKIITLNLWTLHRNPCSLAGTLMHEYTHILGFAHSERESRHQKREYIPYLISDLLVELCEDISS